MALEVKGVLAEQVAPLLARQVVGLGLEERGHRRLGVDHQVLAPRELDHDVGAHLLPVPAHPAHLLVEVTARQQAGVLQHAAQLHLSPCAADRGGVERAREALRLTVERGGRCVHLRDGLLERRELVGAVALERADLGLDPREGVAQRCQSRSGLGVVGERGLEVEDPLAQQVALGRDAGAAHGPKLADGGGCGPGAEHQADDEGEDEFHATDPASDR